ncbi:MAG: hypothetical protein HS115_10105 [Spirochaetales bacterium]|nr:hypothetical protein [Spirochaetales bacterium]
MVRTAQFISALSILFLSGSALVAKPSIWPDLFAADRDFYGSEKEEKYTSTFPLYQVENWNGHFSRRVFFLYKYTDYPLYRRTTFYGFFDHIKSKKDERERTFLPVYYSRLEKDFSYRSFWPVIPILYAYREKSTTRSRHGLFPFYWSDDRGSHHKTFGFPSLPFLYYRKTSGETKSYNTLAGLANITFSRGKLDGFYLFPFFFYQSGEHGHATLFPLVYYNRRGKGSYSLNLPILPLYYRRVHPEQERYNSRTEESETYLEVVDGSFFHRWQTRRVVRTRKSGQEPVAAQEAAEIERMVGILWFIPFYRYKKNPNLEYSNLLFLWGKNYNRQSRLSYSPVHKTYRSLNPENNLQSVDQIHLFHLPLYRHTVYRKESEVMAAFWLYSHRRSTAGDKKSYRRIFNTIVEHDETGKRSRLLFFPLVFWKAAPDGYFHFPVVFHSNHSPGENGCSLALLGLAYASCKNQNREWTAGALGLYFRHRRADSERFWVMPVYNRFSSPKKRTVYRFPLFYERETETEHYRLNVALSTTTGVTLVSPELQLGTEEGGLYFDYSLSFLGNLFSWESRLYLRQPPARKLRELEKVHRSGQLKTDAPQESIRPPSLQQKFIWKKENYRHYYGWSALFGLVAKKYADGYHHMRILPGYWHTYHESQKDVVTWTPVFYRFKYEKLESLYVYPILPLPLYSYQRTETEIRDSVFLWFYSSRQTVDGKEKSLSLFWSLFRLEKNPAGSSHRLLPFYAMRRWQESDGENITRNKRILSPFYYSRSIERPDGSRTEKRMVLPLPVYYVSKNLDREGNVREESSFVAGSYSYRKGSDYGSAFLPFYRNSSRKLENGTVHTSRWNLLHYRRTSTTVAGYRYEKRAVPGFLPLYGSREEQSTDGNFRKSHYFFPLYYVERGNKYYESLFLPGIFIHQSEHYSRFNALYLYDRQEYKESQLVVQGYLFHLWQSTQGKDFSRYRLGWGLLFSRTNYAGEDYRQNILWAFNSRQGSDYHHSFWPFYWFDRTGSREVTALLAPLGYYRSLDADGELSYSLATLGHYHRVDRSERKSRFLLGWGLLYTARTEGSRGYQSKGILWNILWRNQKETDNDYEKTSILGGLIYSRTRLKGRQWQRFFGLFRTGDETPRNFP